ncbi:MAG: 30S ribosomal protein S6 [Desulfuromonadaceae bacterium GWC2_58_13]|nr:MAG: 30S ribosomal protein S6 [Desulfuromonadaceae bacterium GWC2_58_13]
MRTYETIYIVHPEVVGDGYNAVVDKFKGILTDQQASILKVDEWGTRKLAYQVKKQGRGTYVLMAYEAGPTVVAELERRMRIDENVIKFQTVLLEGGFQDSSLPSESVVEADEIEEAEDIEDIE